MSSEREREPVGEGEADPETVARTIVLRRLTLAPRTRSELVKALDSKGVPEDVRDRVLDRFTEVGLVDDSALAASFADSRRSQKGWSRRAIERKLRERGVPRETVTDVLVGIKLEDELESAAALVRSRWARVSGLDPATRQRRLIGMLGRRGYSMSTALAAIRAIDEECPTDADSFA